MKIIVNEVKEMPKEVELSEMPKGFQIRYQAEKVVRDFFNKCGDYSNAETKEDKIRFIKKLENYTATQGLRDGTIIFDFYETGLCWKDNRFMHFMKGAYGPSYESLDEAYKKYEKQPESDLNDFVKIGTGEYVVEDWWHKNG